MKNLVFFPIFLKSLTHLKIGNIGDHKYIKTYFMLV